MISFDLAFNKMLENISKIDWIILEKALDDAAKNAKEPNSKSVQHARLRVRFAENTRLC